MIRDYKSIQNSQRKEEDDLEKYVERFVELNKSKKRKVIEKFVTKILDNFNFRLEVISPRDAVTFLLYQEAYPDIMKLINLMVRKHYDAYLVERAKDKGVR